MKTNKNIDRLFQEKFKYFEVSPPKNTWERIERNLQNNKPKLIFPLWLRLGSIAVVLLLATISSVNYFQDDFPEINDIIITNSDQENTPIINEELLKEDIFNTSEMDESVIVEINNSENNTSSETSTSDKNKLSNEKFRNSNNQTNTVVKVIGNQQNKSIANSGEKPTNLNKPNTIITNNSGVLKEDISPNKHRLKNTLENANNTIATVKKDNNPEKDLNLKEVLESKHKDANYFIVLPQSKKIVQNNTKKSDINGSKNKFLSTQDNNLEEIKDAAENVVKLAENKKEEPLENGLNENIGKEEDAKKWSVASVFAPVYYNSFNTKGSPLDLQFENSPKQGSRTVSYGVKVGYKINNKLSLQSGITLVNVGYKIKNVFINPSQETLQGLVNVKYSNTTNILNVSSQNTLNNVRSETASLTSVKGVLNQEFGYLEIPLELKYKLNNSQKLGVNLVGGFSALFLNKNEVFIETKEFSSNLGEANNLNNVNFSGNFGIDVDYKINKNLYLNVAPMVKIHTSTFSKNAENFKPYTIGVYTGLNYKF